MVRPLHVAIGCGKSKQVENVGMHLSHTMYGMQQVRIGIKLFLTTKSNLVFGTAAGIELKSIDLCMHDFEISKH